jgi:hypothetical protein|tara:strand:+ start:160 stop:1020 length:861 start_codon:yes stop_codon:yes gene_type:complete
MKHPSEIALHQYLDDATNGKSSMSAKTIAGIKKDIGEALKRQFGSRTKRRKFQLRMSNVGRPTCQLWFEKNQPEKSHPLPTTFVMNMMLGDIVEAVFKGLMREAKVKFDDSDKVFLNIGNQKVSGTYDLVLNDAVDDIKSASDWSYRNKFDSFDTVSADDAFGYVGQLAGYAKAVGKKAGGWWVVNKANGSFKYVPADNIDVDKEVAKLEENVKKVESNKFERCYESEEETFRGKPTGNRVLSKTCSFCRYKHACWETLQELPSLVSQAKDPKIVSYVSIRKEKVA